MSAPEAAAAFAALPFLQELSEAHRTRLSAKARRFGAAPGSYLAREGQAAHAFFLIEEGRVAMGTHHADGTLQVFQIVGPGDLVGWSWLLPPHRWQFEARVVDHAAGFMIDGDWLRAECERDPALGFELSKRLLAALARRLSALRRQRGEPAG